MPSLICDLCIVQLNVAYNFKRLALENDFRLRQYLIENGMNVEKDLDIDEPQPTANPTTSLQIHHQQIDVIVDRPRPGRFREPDPPNRRNSAVSTASTSTCFNNRENVNTPSSTIQEMTNRFILPKPMIRPIQIKVEPADLTEGEEVTNVLPTASPASSDTRSRSDLSHITVATEKSPPMVQIPPDTVVEVQSSPESAKNKETELNDSDTAESYSGNTPEVPPLRLPPSQYSTNESIEPAPPTPPRKKLSSPSTMETRKRKEDLVKSAKDVLRKVRGLRPIQRKSMNEVNLRRENKKEGEKLASTEAKKHVDKIVKATGGKNKERKKTVLENFLKTVSSSLKIRKKNSFKIKGKTQLKNQGEKKRMKNQTKGKRNDSGSNKMGRPKKNKNEIQVKRKYVRKGQENKQGSNISKD